MALAAAVALLLACTREPKPAPGTTPTRDGVLVAATLNAGLARGWLGEVPRRRDALRDALSRTRLDLLCVQEYWSETDWRQLAAASSLRHHQRAAVAGHGCNDHELATLLRCNRACSSAADDQVVACLASRCQELVAEVDRDCVECALAHGVGDSLADECAESSPPTWSGGVGVLSRYPLTDPGVLELEPDLVPRVALHARIDDTPLGSIRLVCTHLSAPLNVPGYGAVFRKLQRRQLQAILALVADDTPPGPVLLLGDFNTGPAVAGATALLPDNYRLLLDAGFVSGYASRPDARCSRCNANPLVGGSGTGGVLIDHVLLRGLDTEAEASRWLPGDGARPLSDHFGIRVVLRRPHLKEGGP